jgi:hypothetical protein
MLSGAACPAKISLVNFSAPFMFPAMDMFKSGLNRFVLPLLAALLLAPVLAFAQMPGAGANMMDSAMLKLFGTHTAFSCKAEFHVVDASPKGANIVPLGLSIEDGKMRMDVDFAEVKSPDMPPAMVPTLKQLGMDQSVIIQRPDKKMFISIYPRAKAYCEKPMSKDEMAASERTYTVNKDKLGKEDFEGHACEKDKVTLTDDKGVKHYAIVWYATDLKDFPVQIQMTEQDQTLVMKFRDVKLSRPDHSRFEAPAGLTKYKSEDALMEAATKGTLPK